MSKELRLQIVMNAINKATAPIKQVMESSRSMAKELHAAKAQLKALENQDKLIESFRATDRAISVKTNAIAGLTPRLKALKEEINATSTPSKALVREFERVRNEAATLKGEKTKLLEKAQRLRTELEKAGMPTRELAKHQQDLHARIKETTAAVAEQDKKFKAHGETLRKAAATKAQYDKAMENRNKLAGAGASMMATGAAMGAPVAIAVRDYSTFEDAMLGVARQVEGARNAAGQLTPVYYEMAEAIKTMGERIPMATTEIAALIEAGAKMGIQGKQNLLTFAETAAITATAFDLPADRIGEDMAKLAQLYKVPIANIAELGDAINWLDDGAQSSGADIIEVMKRIAGTADGLGMAYKEAAALGSTFLSLGSSAEVAASASNAMMRELSIATMQSKTFKAGIGMLGLNAGQIQLSMSKDSTGTILRVLEAIRALPQEKQIEATTRLFGKEFGDDAAKLANNLDEYRKQLALVRAEEAKGSMAREADAKNQALSAQYQMAKNSLFSVTSALGETLKPALVEIMQATAAVLGGVRDWVKENPGLASALMKTAAAAALIVTILGGLALAVAAVIGPIAILRYGMDMLSIRGGGMLSMLLRLGSSILPMVGRAILFIGRALLMTPLGLAISAIGLLFYKYWAPISAFLSGLWEGVSSKAGPALSKLWEAIGVLRIAFAPLIFVLNTVWEGLKLLFGWIGELLTPVDAVDDGVKSMGLTIGETIGGIIATFLGLPTKLLVIGGQIIDGLWQGLVSKWESIKAKVAEIANSVANAFKGALGIHSPSRVFAELGGYTMQGLQLGLQNAAAGPLNAVTRVAGNLAAAGAVALGASLPALAVDNRPPLTPPRAGATGGMGADTIQIIVQAAPGMDESRLADLVAKKLEDLQRRKAAAGRSRLTDAD